jgi:hypothetical protein
MVRIGYLAFVFLSLLMLVWAIWINGLEFVERCLGHDTYISQMEHLSLRASVIYSGVFLAHFLLLLFFGVRHFRKGNRKKTLLLSVLVWVFVVIELYADTIVSIKI